MPRYDIQKDAIDRIKVLDGYVGYVQFSNRALEILVPHEIKTPNEDEDVFLVEAHYYSGADNKSIAVRYHAGAWYFDETDLSKVEKRDEEIYQAKGGKQVRLSQVWEKTKDKYCNGWEVKRLQKVVFAGFVNTGGES